MPGFRLQAKKLFLTYSQCTASKEELLEFLWNHPVFKEQNVTPKFIRVAKEQHSETIGEHLHALVILDMKVRTRSPRFLDFEGFHGSYEPVVNLFASMKYLEKENDWIDRGVCVDIVQGRYRYNNELIRRYHAFYFGGFY